jgi:phenylacetate-CoA ligase
MGSFNNVIKKMPNFLQIMYYDVVPFEKRYGRNFIETFNFLCHSAEWDTKRLLEYQNDQLLKIISHSYENVPYYKNLFDTHGIKLSQIQNKNDLKIIPFLTKDLIRDNIENLKSKNFPELKKHEFRTSGSTGNKLVFYGTDELYKKEAAFVLRAYKQHGATLYDTPSVWLRRFVPKKTSDSLWYYDHELRRLYMSAYHMNRESIKNYVEEINKKRYHTLVAYPSSAYILACLCEEHNLKLKSIEKIHVTSEMLLDQWRDKIIKVFGIIPVAHYGSIEKVSFMHQKEDSKVYYNNLEYGLTEFESIDNTSDYSIVSTGFLDYYMPFIRYRTEDSVKLNPDMKSTTLPDEVLSINGRSSDILVSENGSLLPGVNFYSWIDKSVPGVKMFQIIQKTRNDVIFNYVESQSHNEITKKEIETGLQARLGNLNFEINRVEEIPRNESSGKIRCIINLI